MSNHINNKNNGFTLIELMITVAIVGILVSVALPSYLSTVRKTHRTDAYDALLDCAAAQARAYSTSGQPSYLTDAQATAAGLCPDSKQGFYSLAITNPNCSVTVAGNQLNSCFSVTATAINSQVGDTDCATLTVDHVGRKTAASSAPDDTSALCWR